MPGPTLLRKLLDRTFSFLKESRYRVIVGEMGMLIGRQPARSGHTIFDLLFDDLPEIFL